MIVKQYPRGYPKSFEHIGDHVKAVRLERGFLQKDVGAILGVTPDSVLSWEKGYSEPALSVMARVICFLNYCPIQFCETLPKKFRAWRITRGISLEICAHFLGVDAGTLVKFEAGRKFSRQFGLQFNAEITQLVLSEDLAYRIAKESER